MPIDDFSRIRVHRRIFAEPLKSDAEFYERLLYKIRTARINSDCSPSNQKSADDNLIDVFCPQCHKLLTFRSTDFGEKCWCPGCGHIFIVSETDPLARYCAQVRFTHQKPPSDNFVAQSYHPHNSNVSPLDMNSVVVSDARSYHWYATLFFLPFTLFLVFSSCYLLYDCILHYSAYHAKLLFIILCITALSSICGIHHAWLAIFKREFFKSSFISKLLEFLP